MVLALFLKNSIVTIDAIGTQKEIVKKIIDSEAHYILPVKGNQKQLYEDVSLYLDALIDGKFPGVKFSYHETYDKGHGREEIRKCWSTNNIGWLYRRGRWKKLQSISVIESIVTKKGKITVTRRYYISNLSADACILLAVVRNHWGIENKLHWPLNVSFREHISISRKGRGAENLGILRCVALSLLQNHSSPLSVNNKRMRAAYDYEYLLEVLCGKKIDFRSHTEKIIDYLKAALNNFTHSMIQKTFALLS